MEAKGVSDNDDGKLNNETARLISILCHVCRLKAHNYMKTNPVVTICNV